MLGDGAWGLSGSDETLRFISRLGCGHIGQQQLHGAHAGRGLYLICSFGISRHEVRQAYIGIGKSSEWFVGRHCGQHHGFAELVFTGTLEGMKHIAGFRHHDGTGILVKRVGHGFFPTISHMDKVGETPEGCHLLVPFQRSGGVAAVQRVGQCIGFGLQRDDLGLYVTLTIGQLIQHIATLCQGGTGLVQCGTVIIGHGLRLTAQRFQLMLRIIMLLGERLPLPGMILGAAVRQLYGGFLSGYQFTQTGDMGVTLLRGFTELGQGLTDGSELLFIVGALFGGLIKCDAGVRHGFGLRCSLSLQLFGPLEQHVRVFSEIADDLAGERTSAFLGQLGKRMQTLPDLGKLMPILIGLGNGRAGFGTQRLDLFDAHLDLGKLALGNGQLTAHIAEFLAHRLAASHRTLGILGIDASLGVTYGNLNGIGPARNARLTAQRAKLPVNLSQ